MRGNLFRTGNEVIIEGVSVGHFQSIETTNERDSLQSQCTILLPIYTIGMSANLTPSERIRSVLADALIKPGAKIDVYVWYYDRPEFEQSFQRVHEFSGYIREVQGGFPSKLICEDHSFVLRFGTIGRDWSSRTALADMINYILPIANEAFEQYRRNNGFLEWDNFPHLYFEQSESAEVEFALQVFKNISPFDALTKLLKMFALYGMVNKQGGVYFGIGIADREKRTVLLATNTNVIERDIVPQNGLFENYKVVVTGLMSNGTKYTKELGDSEAQAERYFCPINTPEGIDQFANSVMMRLKGNRNKGTIKTVLYPNIDLFDFINYTDTLFPELGGNYYVTGRQFEGSVSTGYIQTLTVTNELFVL